MKQCNAKTKLGLRCNRPAAKECASYCRQHFNMLPSGTAESKSKRDKAKNMLKRAGNAISTGVGLAEIIQEIWDLVGPFLSFSEGHKLEIIGRSFNSDERIDQAKLLVRSLSRA